MNFYNNIHPYYCGIDLHARTLYVCIIDQGGETCAHKEIPADPDRLHQLLEPYLGNVVLGVECMHCSALTPVSPYLLHPWSRGTGLLTTAKSKALTSF